MTAPHAVFGCVAIPVTDLERSTRFYCGALGFSERATTRPNGGASGVTARFLEKTGIVIELVALAAPPPPDRSTQPMSATGALSHLAFNVADLAATESAVVALGGAVLEASRNAMELAGLGPVEILYVRDPDGVWIELLSVDENARRRYAGLAE